MDIDNLVTMANQIAEFYETMPDRNEALKDISMHFTKFWNPRMRRELLAYIDSTGGVELTPMVLESIRSYRNLLS